MSVLKPDLIQNEVILSKMSCSSFWKNYDNFIFELQFWRFLIFQGLTVSKKKLRIEDSAILQWLQNYKDSLFSFIDLCQPCSTRKTRSIIIILLGGWLLFHWVDFDGFWDILRGSKISNLVRVLTSFLTVCEREIRVVHSIIGSTADSSIPPIGVLQKRLLYIFH